MKIQKYTLSQMKEALESLSNREKSVFSGGVKYTVDRDGIFSHPIADGNNYATVECGSETYRCQGDLVFNHSTIPYDNPNNGWPTQGTLTSITGGDKGLFEFLADNTDVEWGASWNGGKKAGSSTSAYLTTINKKDMSVDYVKPGYDTHAHSHPNESLVESAIDRRGISNWEDNGYKYLYTYGKKSYRQYN